MGSVRPVSEHADIRASRSPVDVIAEVAEVIAAGFPWVLEYANVTADARLRDDLQLDSLHLVALQVAVEDRLGIRFDTADAALLDAFESVGALGSYAARRLESER